MDAGIHGHCDRRFSRVAGVFGRHFERGEETGAALCVYQGDDIVVDLWAGHADQRAGRRWERDTPCLAFSCAKAVTAVSALRLAEAGACALDGPVAAWWPEFAAAGKERTTGVHLLSHQAGLPAFRDPVTVAEAADPAALAARLAAQSPEWEPGTAHGYHALTYGWLAGELVRRRSGRTVGEYLAEHIAGPHGLGLWLGGPADVIAQAARISRGPAGRSGAPGSGDPGPGDPRDGLTGAAGAEVRDLARRAFGNPDPTSVPGGSNSLAVLIGRLASQRPAGDGCWAGRVLPAAAGRAHHQPGDAARRTDPEGDRAGPGAGGECGVRPGVHAPLGIVLGSGGRSAGRFRA